MNEQHLQLSDLSKTELRNAIMKLAPSLGFAVEFGSDAFGGDGLDAWIEEVRQHLTVSALCHLVRCHHDEACDCRCGCSTKDACRVFECNLYEVSSTNRILGILVSFHNTLKGCLAYLQGFARGRSVASPPDGVARSARESASSR